MTNKQQFPWADLSDEQLLEMRICDLGLSLEGTWVEKQISKLGKELAKKNLLFKPHVWISEDWFSPDGIPGFAVPFYLLHPRLIALEKKIIGEAEGEGIDWCMQLMRHETGHAVDNAFRLRKKKIRQKVFGLSSKTYPTSYSPDFHDKNFVIHLDSSYAQSHPDEDWAETFATWMTPGSKWKKTYEKWPAITKLNTLDTIMGEIKGKRSPNKRKEVVDDISTLDMTLGEYYLQKTERLGIVTPDQICKELGNVFSPSFTEHFPKASSFLRKGRKEICIQVAKKAKLYEGEVNHVMGMLMTYCQERNLHLCASETQTKKRVLAVLTKNSRKYFRNNNKVFM